ncbi:MAG TPA: aspartate ammonia-lyase [Acidobacteriota bacterium]|nr:aspartate ammonia-lyase [Acidobacteriota bacterium]HQG92720.1 aspartate ammonia-lyase [Acidobacteriota bacterium]
MTHRQENDSLGARQVPAGAYYGVQTLRAVENFPITGVAIGRFPLLIRALGAIKKAAAQANMDLKILPPDLGAAIVQAADEVMDGRYNADFVVDVIQGGAGTSTNMNANEVIANRALELLGRPRGDYAACHPNNHVNLSQSTNDVYPTALKLAAIWKIRRLLDAMGQLQDAFALKGEEFKDVLKLGRTQLQDAVPMTLGQEFAAVAITIGEDMERLREAARLIHEMNMGATAIGTGVNTVPGYTDRVRARLIEITGLSLITAPNLIEATSDAGAYVQLSGVLKRIAVKLSKVCNDLRLLSSGPRGGIGEILLPAMQPGSTIMPGKVNPVIPEVVNQVCFEVIGLDVAISMAAQAGQLELNAFEPLIGFNIFLSMDMLERAATVLRERCVAGIRADRERCRELLERSTGIVTALVPVIGYEAAARLAHESLDTGRPVRELALAQGLLDEAALNELLNPALMTHPRAIPGR